MNTDLLRAPSGRLADPSATSRSSHRPQLDGIRAVAVTMVVLFHLGFGWIPGGFTGVDVFFVLSGYLISGLLLSEASGSGRVQLARFYARRARRLLPAAWVVVVFSVVVGKMVSSPIDYPHLRRHAMSAVLYVANWDWATVDRGYFATDTEPSPLIHFWSLAVEEQFYVVWPALVLGCLWAARRLGRRVDETLLAAFGVVTVVSVALALALTPSTAAYYGTHTRAFELSAGGMLAVLLYQRRRRAPGSATTSSERRLATLVGALGLAAAVVLALLIHGDLGYPGLPAVAVTAATVALIAGADLSDSSPLARALGNPVFAWLGRLSYSIYLWHWPFIVFFADRLDRISLTIAILAVSQASYTLVEQPLRHRAWPKAPYRAVFMVGAVTSIVLGLLVVPAHLANTTQERVLIRELVSQKVESETACLHEKYSESQLSCTVHVGSGATIAIVGDSHANHWLPALKRLAARNDWTLVRTAHPGCPVNSARQAVKPRQQECAPWREAAFADLVSTYDPDYVILANRSYQVRLKTPAGDVATGSPEHVAAWGASWDQTIRTLRAGGARVGVVQALPTMPEGIARCLADNPDNKAACDFPLASDPDLMPYLEATRQVGRRLPDVTILDPLPFVCPDEFCPAFIDGVLVRIDNDHLSKDFVEAHTRDVARMLAPMGLR